MRNSYTNEKEYRQNLVLTFLIPVFTPIFLFVTLQDLWHGNTFEYISNAIMTVLLVCLLAVRIQKFSSAKRYRLNRRLLFLCVLNLGIYTLVSLLIQHDLSKLPWTYLFLLLAIYTLDLPLALSVCVLFLSIFTWFAFTAELPGHNLEFVTGFRIRFTLSLWVLTTVSAITMHVWQQSAKNSIDQQRTIEKSLGEKEVLLKEIHHRVKNNMQIMSSLVNIESAKIEDENLIPHLENIKDRIRTIALVHEHLYHSESFSSIDLKEHIDELARLLVGNFRNRSCRVNVRNNLPALRVELGTAINLGLIYNEIFTNSLKYAFRGRNHGTIYLDFNQNGDEFVLAVSDNGIGVDPGIQLETASSTGMTIIRSLVEQLGGSASLRSDTGTHYELRFPATFFTLSP